MDDPQDTSDGPVDPRDVERDEHLTEAVRSGTPPEWFSAYGQLARYRAEVDAGQPQDPATTALPHVRYGSPIHNPIAFLPVSTGEVRTDVPPRVDDWCEDRPPAELSDDDGDD